MDGVHTGGQYHQVILASRRDRWVRRRFQKMALALLPARADVLDFGAGTGIDARIYAAGGHRTFVYEPAPAMRDYLVRYCHDEIASGTVITETWPITHKVHAITANFAVLNHIADQAALFEEFSRVTDPGCFVLASMLSPFYLGDARCRWWWANAANLLRSGHYPSPGESRILRFAPRAIVRAAAPHFRLERLDPYGFGLAIRLYMFLLFRRI
jgi:SAM-dependent methyltransferase